MSGPDPALKALAQNGARLVGDLATGGRVEGVAPPIRVSAQRMRALLEAGLIAPAGQAGLWRLSRAGAGRLAASGGAPRIAECSLDWLAVRRDAQGTPLIDATEKAAGERLRADWEAVHQSRGLVRDWSRGPSDRTARGAADGLAPGEAAAAARRRLREAFAALGPELAAAARAAACEGVGLEALEARHGWPRRSGKLVVKLALGALARHYGMAPCAWPPSDAWLAEDARPTL